MCLEDTERQLWLCERKEEGGDEIGGGGVEGADRSQERASEGMVRT